MDSQPPMRVHPWRNPNHVGWLYVASESCFGHGQAGKGIKDGDLVLCIRHSGDCFYDFILVTESEPGRLTGHPETRIGSYALGFHCGISEREYHLLAAGYQIAAPDHIHQRGGPLR